ncbi:MAG: hypothetical protein PF508_22440 [Spirochaeta sp.]|jgi:hypothetical protein|nr:hypothetical protein [Spirochaeta sp.]
MKLTGRRGLLRDIFPYGIAISIALLLITGCDNLFGEEEEDDGTLAVSVSGYDGSCAPSTDNEFFIVFVMAGGADPNTGTVLAAGGGDQITGDTASATARVWDPQTEKATDVVWEGSGGDRYDVYPTVYCGADLESIDLDDPYAVYGAMDYSQPLTYKQDGNQSFSTDFSDYSKKQ